jgi:predicted nucleic acid-binding protein
MAVNSIFMDTAGFLALWDAADEHHERAVRLQTDVARKGRRFLTSDYVTTDHHFRQAGFNPMLEKLG